MKWTKVVNSAVNNGWVVNEEEAYEKLQLWIDEVGAEKALDDVARAIGNGQLAEALAYIFRMNDFEEGTSFKFVQPTKEMIDDAESQALNNLKK